MRTIIGRNFIVKNAENFSEHNAKFHLKIPYRDREIVKKAKRCHSFMTTLTMFTQNQNPPINFVGTI